MKKSLTSILFSIGCVVGFAQTPVIQSIDPLINYPTDTINISGNGFSNNAAQLDVWFGPVRGTIHSASESFLKVIVPPQAHHDNIKVVNLVSRLSAKSRAKFLPTFSGAGFTASSFSIPLSFSSVDELWDLCSCDFNRDGRPDMAVTKFVSPSSNLLILNNQSTPGTLSFNTSTVNLSIPTDHAVCGDLDGDGKPDLVVTRSGSIRNSVHILRNTTTASTITFAQLPALFLSADQFLTRATRLVLKDLNKDGKPEIIVSNSATNVLYIFVNQSTAGSISFNATPVALTVANAAETYGLEVQDFNGDGLPDILVNQFQRSDIFLLKNLGGPAINFGPAQRIVANGTFNKFGTADFNKDGLTDIVISSTQDNKPTVVLLNTSTSNTFSFSTPIELMSDSGPWGVDICDIDGDQDPDIIIANRFENKIHAFLHNGNFNSISFTKVDISTNRFVRNIIAGDLDGDGKPDLAFTTFGSGSGPYSIDILRNTTCYQPKILNETPLEICTGQTIALRTAPGVNTTYTWRKDGNATPISTGTSPTVNITSHGTYSVEVTEAGCGTRSSSITIAANTAAAPNPTIDANTPLCSGATLSFSASTITGGSYKWTGPEGFTSTQQNPSITGIRPSQAGEYKLQVQVGQCRSNVARKVVDVVDLETLQIQSSSITNIICEGTSVNLAVDNRSGNTYQWKKNGTNLSGQTNTTLTVTEEGNYTVVVTNTALQCSREADPVTVTVLQLPQPQFQAKATACTGEAVSFTDQSQVDSRATAVYAWEFGDTKTSSSKNAANTYIQANTYTVKLTVSYTGMSSCSASTTKSINIVTATLPHIQANRDSFCEGESTTLSVAATFPSITWNNGATTPVTTVSAGGTFKVNTVDANGCNGTDQIVITLHPAPVLTVTATPPAIRPGESSLLVATGAATYVWTPTETLNDPTLPNPTAKPTTNTTYTVTGTSDKGCTAQAEVIITIDGSEIMINAPKAFSPNGDGQNEAWIIEGVESYFDCTLSVFDGRGRRIYEKTGYTNDWNGTYNGQQVPQGTYYYVFGCPGKKPKTGNVLIVR